VTRATAGNARDGPADRTEPTVERKIVASRPVGAKSVSMVACYPGASRVGRPWPATSPADAAVPGASRRGGRKRADYLPAPAVAEAEQL